MAIVTATSFIRHSTIIVLVTQIHDTILTQFIIMLQKTEINQAMGLCVKAANQDHKV